MHIKDVYSLADEYFAKHNLNGWKFTIGKRARSLGICNYNDKVIEFSKHYLHIPDLEIKDTILHEIAHALVDSNNGHNNIWKRKAIEIGARPQRCTSNVETSKEPNYILRCHHCGKDYKFFRKPKRRQSCNQCCPGRFNEKFILELIPIAKFAVKRYTKEISIQKMLKDLPYINLGVKNEI